MERLELGAYTMVQKWIVEETEGSYVSRDFKTFLCIAQHSDLAFESLETVSEFRHWKADISCRTGNVHVYYQASHYQKQVLRKWLNYL